MPKIKLSALISDIKGKANGSVFARNSGGVYYRNNPSGGGRKSTTWDRVKAQFSKVSSGWRALTNEQRLAWNAAVSEYNTHNVFGDNRIPSGYELYMRVNQTLSANGLSPIIAPRSPEPLPDVTECMVLTSDERMLQTNEFWVTGAGMPLSFSQRQNVYNANERVKNPFDFAIKCVPGRLEVFDSTAYAQLVELASSTILSKEIKRRDTLLVFGGSVVVSNRSNAGTESDPVIYLSSPKQGEGNINIKLVGDTSNDWQIHIFIKGVSQDTKLVYDIDEAFVSPLIKFYVMIDLGSLGDSIVVINGTHPTLNSGDSDAILFDTDEVYLNPLPVINGVELISGFNEYFLDAVWATSEVPTAIKLGYYPEDLSCQMVLSKNSKNGIYMVNEGEFVDPPLIIDINTDNFKPSFMPFQNSPAIALFKNFNLDPRFILVLKVSKPLSIGSMGARDDFQTIARFENDVICNNCVSQAMFNKFGDWINDSTFRFGVQAINVGTGQVTPVSEVNLRKYPPVVDWGDAHWEGWDCPAGYIFVNGWCIDMLYDWGQFNNDDKDKKTKPKFKVGITLAGTVK